MKALVAVKIFWFFLFAGSCTSYNGADSAASRQWQDTSYITSTQDLKRNKIPDSVFLMTSLKHLVVRGMDCDYGPVPNCWEISELPATVGNLVNLETLRLPVNALNHLPSELALLKELRVVDFSDCLGLHDIGVLTKLDKLEELDLYGCGITHLPKGLNQLTQLRVLGLKGNPLDKREVDIFSKNLPGCRVVF
jgi:leucine-rich repeat protein SHOC2